MTRKILISTIVLSTFAVASGCSTPPTVASKSFNGNRKVATTVYTPAQIAAEFKDSGKKVITFIGYSGAKYENEAAMLDIARNELGKLKAKDWIVNIGVTPDGIGQVYCVASKLGFETRGIVSELAKDYLDTVECVDRYYLVSDTTWGGRQPDGNMSPTSEAMVSVSDRVIGIGGGDVGYDELVESMNRHKDVHLYSAEMNHAKALKKNPAQTNFYGKPQSLIK